MQRCGTLYNGFTHRKCEHRHNLQGAWRCSCYFIYLVLCACVRAEDLVYFKDRYSEGVIGETMGLAGEGKQQDIYLTYMKDEVR